MNREGKIVCLLGLLYVNNKNKLKNKKQPRRWWVRHIFLNRKNQGAFHNRLKEMSLTDLDKFFNYLRMSHQQFEGLLRLVGPLIEKLHIKREPISAAQRLSVTLRYLASGDSMISLSYAFRLGKTTVSNIINETCKAIWNILNPIVFVQDSEQNWTKISQEFELMWQLPNCIGAVDGKHIVIQAPPNSGSEYFNYKKTHSIVLMALYDAQYKFIAVDIGAQGRQSDGGIFRSSDIERRLLNSELKLPAPKAIELGGMPIPYYAVGDSAFPLNNHLMRPYAGSFLPQYKRIFNYRLSRGRRVSENSFGILASKWRSLRKPIIASLDTVESVVGAVVVLHNWMSDRRSEKYCPSMLIDREDITGNITTGEWRSELEMSNLKNINKTSSNMYKKGRKKLEKIYPCIFIQRGQFLSNGINKINKH